MTTIPDTPPEWLTRSVQPPPPATLTISELCVRAGAAVNTMTALVGEATDLHTSAVSTSAQSEALRLGQAAQALAAWPMVDLLARLAEVGLAWRDIASLAGVSVPAVRKWRQGGPAGGSNRLTVARLVALVDWLEHEKHIFEVASWLEVPLVPAVPITRLDLLRNGREDLVIASLTGPETPAEAILDAYEPGWRDRDRSDFEVFDADDGFRSIRRRDPQ